MSALSSAEALLTEHLQYTPLSLIDDVINTINAIIYRALTAIEDGMLPIPPALLGFDRPSIPADSETPASTSDSPEERQRAEIEEGVHRLETLLEATVDKTFDKFEIYTLRNILHVPDGLERWMRLRHYEGLQIPLSQDAATPEVVRNLRQRLQATQQLNLTLSQAHKANDRLLSDLRTVLSSPDGQLSHLAGSSALLQPQAQFTKSQLPALKSLLDDLRPRLQIMSDLAKEGAKPGQYGEERDQRARYVEDVVERVVQTQLGATKEVDEELGRRRAENEVRIMERIAAEGVREAAHGDEMEQ